MPLLLCEWLEPMVAIWVTFSHLIGLPSSKGKGLREEAGWDSLK